MTKQYGPKSQKFVSDTDDIENRFCTCDECGRHVHNDDRMLTSNVEDFWFCTTQCKSKFMKSETASRKAIRLQQYAPEMYRFLKVLADQMDHDPNKTYQTILDGALAILSKVEGK